MRLDISGFVRQHPDAKIAAGGQDLHSLFASRASALGWSTSSLEATGRSLRWGMNDAGFGRCGDQGLEDPWVQVDARADPGNCLPIQELFGCMESTLRRLGHLDLRRVSLLLPLDDEVADAARLFDGLNWFDAGLSEGPTPISVDLCLPASLPSVADPAMRVLESLPEVRDANFSVDGRRAQTRAEPLALSRFSAREMGNHEVIRVPAVLPEWTLPAVGWFSSHLSQALSVLEQKSKVLLAIQRA